MKEPLISIRPIALEDAEKIAEHRHRMFLDDGIPDDERMHILIEAFIHWVKARIQLGTYSGWFALDGDRVVAGTGMMVIDWPPHPLHVEPLRGYILNVYTEPSYRGRGIARQLVRQAMEEAAKRKIGLVSLHASKMGRPVYEKLGFNRTSEMRWMTTNDVPNINKEHME